MTSRSVNGALRLIRVFGINVYVHWTWFLLALVLYQMEQRLREPSSGARAGSAGDLRHRAAARVRPRAGVQIRRREGRAHHALAAGRTWRYVDPPQAPRCGAVVNRRGSARQRRACCRGCLRPDGRWEACDRACTGDADAVRCSTMFCDQHDPADLQHDADLSARRRSDPARRCCGSSSAGRRACWSTAGFGLLLRDVDGNPRACHCMYGDMWLVSSWARFVAWQSVPRIRRLPQAMARLRTRVRRDRSRPEPPDGPAAQRPAASPVGRIRTLSRQTDPSQTNTGPDQRGSYGPQSHADWGGTPPTEAAFAATANVSMRRGPSRHRIQVSSPTP